MGARLTRHAICLMLSLAVAACSPAQPNATGAGSGTIPGTSSSPAANQPADLGAAEVSLRRDNRARAGLANLGPGAMELAGLMDAAGAQALADAGPKVDAIVTGTALSAPTVRFASLTTPGSTIFAPWEFTTTYFERAMVNGISNTRSVTDQDLPNGAGADSRSITGEPVTKPVTIGGNSGTITTSVTETTAFDGSKISMELDFKLHAETHDANGATILTIESSGKGHIDGDACPDASGISKAHIALSASETYVGAGVAGSAYGLRQDFSADVRIRADDQANLAGIEIVAKGHETSQGGVPAAGGTSDLAAHDLDAGFTRTLGYDATSGFGAATTSNESASSVEATNLYLGMALYTEFPAKILAKAIETAWRSGMCIRVSPSPSGADVAKDSTTQVKVIVRQRYEDAELDKPVVATLDSGPKAIDPAGQALPAPATFTYTAGPKTGDNGVVTFTSTSNRGIGKTSVAFRVGGGWHIDQSSGGMAVKGQKCGSLDGMWTFVGTIKSAQIDSTATWIATINGTTLLGTYTYKAVLKSYPGAVTTMTGTGRASIAVQPNDANGYLAGTVDMTIFGTTITSTAVGFGTSQTVHIPIPDGHFKWSPGASPGATCR